MSWRCEVYDKDNNQINWLDDWENKEDIILQAKNTPNYHHHHCYEVDDIFEALKNNEEEKEMKKITKEQLLDMFSSAPIEVILCIYCGRRLNRFGEGNNLPTSCRGCHHHDFIPKVHEVLILDDFTGDKN